MSARRAVRAPRPASAARGGAVLALSLLMAVPALLGLSPAMAAGADPAASGSVATSTAAAPASTSVAGAASVASDAASAAEAPAASVSAAGVGELPASGAAAGDAASAASPAASAPAAPATPPGVLTTVEQPRSFGHVLGDVLVQRVLLPRDGPAVDPASLPAADRVGLFLERHAARTEADDAGRRWLVLTYQVVNAPRALTATSLPALSLGTGPRALQVPAWPVSIGPLTPAATFDQGALQPLRPDRPVEAVPTVALERRLMASLAALAAVLAAWAAWWAWRNAREAHRLPFARAWHRLRRADPASAEAWLALHRALNDTAGRVVHGRTLPRLLAEAPHLQPLAPQLEAFFRHSEQRFFATAAGTAPGDLSLRDLGRALHDAERRHHR